ncbi:MAG TPA: hypothetical protein VJI75_06400 [Candidatus Nanoarchaeia archaeon]|nr:hypothetical protein [Candidatus Nanoarchaeia archaeon]
MTQNISEDLRRNVKKIEALAEFYDGVSRRNPAGAGERSEIRIKKEYARAQIRQLCANTQELLHEIEVKLVAEGMQSEDILELQAKTG